MKKLNKLLGANVDMKIKLGNYDFQYKNGIFKIVVNIFTMNNNIRYIGSDILTKLIRNIFITKFI